MPKNGPKGVRINSYFIVFVNKIIASLMEKYKHNSLNEILNKILISIIDDTNPALPFICFQLLPFGV